MPINARAFEEMMITNISAGIDEYTRRMVERMKRRAPVGKDRSVSNPRATYAVRPRRMGSNAVERYVPQGTNDDARRKDRLRQQRLIDISEGGEPGTRLSDVVASSEANRFVFAAGPHKGQIPDTISLSRRGAVRGYRRRKSGTLRDSIHIVPARIEGTTIVGGVAVDAPYAKAIEYGFIHHSHGKSTGRRVRQKPFFRPVWKENQAAGAARLARYVKRAGK